MSAFDRSGRFEHELPDILAAIAVPRVPDYYDDLLAQAAATSQRPRWTFLERWPGMDAITYRVAVPSFPWRPFVVAALLLIVALAALLVAGSQPHVPAPFGPAKNGALVYGDGDIYIRDGIDGASRALITGPDFDFAAGFTRNGEKLVFLRRTSGIAGEASERLAMFTANRDGSNVAAVSEPMISPDWADFAPDGSIAVISAGDPQLGQHLFVADLRDPGHFRPIDLGDQIDTATTPNFLGPTGAEIVFRGSKGTGTGTRRGLFAAHPDGTGLRPLTPTDGTLADDRYSFPQPSPDGRYIAYTVWNEELVGNAIHVVDLQTGEDRTLTDVGRSEGWATFSPDSSRIVFVNYVADREQIFVAPVDGKGPRLPMGPAYRTVQNESLDSMFSPDGKWVIVSNSATDETRIVDAATGGDGDVLLFSPTGISGWQRLAP